MDYDLFDEKRVTVPRHLQHVVPKTACNATHELRSAAILAAKGLRHMQALRNARHEAMCPNYPSPCTSKHVESLERLFEKRLSRSAEPAFTRCSMPSEVTGKPFQFHKDQLAYDQFASFYSSELEYYLSDTYTRYLMARARLDVEMREADLDDLNRQEWEWWWNKVYLVEMSKWEKELKELVIPSWEEIIDELHQALNERAKLEPVDCPELNVVSGPEKEEA